MTTTKVELYIYDLSNGMAAIVSPLLIGFPVNGIWHTSIVAYGTEWFFGSTGVEQCSPGGTALGPPLQKIVLGETEIPYQVFHSYILDIGESTYAPSTYDLFKHNCNNFTDDLAQFLCNAKIPQYILELPNKVLQSNLGRILAPLAQQLEQSARPVSQGDPRTRREESPEFEQLNSQIEEERYNSFIREERRKRINEKLIKKERKLEKKRKKILKAAGICPEETIMAESENAMNGSAEMSLPSEQALLLEEEERQQEEELKKLREPPVVYKDLLDINVEFDALVGLIDGKLSGEEQTSLEELHKFMLEDEGSWVLGEHFLVFIGRLLNDPSLPPEVRVRTLNVLALAALKDDVILLLHQDRREHILMNYAYDIDRHSNEEQEATALFMCNMFESLSSSEWLLYISEWSYKGQQTSNIRVTTKVAVHSLLADSAVLQERGAAIIHNLAIKEVFDDVVVELAMALLQFFQSQPNEENLFRTMKAMSKFVQVSRQEVPQLIQMIGPDPRTFKGVSERIDQLIEDIGVKCR